QRSGVSARFAVTATETVAASALRRAAMIGEDTPVARVGDLPSVVPSVRGKVEFEAAEEGRELEVLAHLLRKATAETFRARLTGTDLSAVIDRFSDGTTVETGELVAATALLTAFGPLPGLAKILERLGIHEETPALAAAGIEFALEGLHLTRRLGKEELPGRTVYGG
ncbi:MAG: magnesium chelatase subunit, partial [Frankiaceae bacterium]|nr:magnesium chelatase subunit [Frankiaceae bacterium]